MKTSDISFRNDNKEFNITHKIPFDIPKLRICVRLYLPLGICVVQMKSLSCAYNIVPICRSIVFLFTLNTNIARTIPNRNFLVVQIDYM